MINLYPFAELAKANLIVDAVYEGGDSNSAADDPISKLLIGVGNQGGFRSAGLGITKRFVGLYSSNEDKDWPDFVDYNTGQFTYYGDTKKPGTELHSEE